MRSFKTEDGYTFYLQPDGTLTDTRNAQDADLVYGSLDLLQSDSELEEITAAGEWSIFDYWNDRLGTDGVGPDAPAPDDQAGYPHLVQYPMESECGKACKLIIDAAAALLAVSDPAAHDDILKGTLTAVNVVCFG